MGLKCASENIHHAHYNDFGCWPFVVNHFGDKVHGKVGAHCEVTRQMCTNYN